MRPIKITYTCLLLLITFSCRERFEPNLKSSPDSYLVVDGVLNAGTGPTSIRLTRSYKLDRSAQVGGELNANVTVEGKDNSARQLNSSGDGYYLSNGLNLTLENDYRLRIKTADGKEYLSDFITARLTPPIDSIGWHRSGNGLQMYVNTGDPTNKTLYYRWEYDATWEIRSVYASHWRFIDGVNPKVVPRGPADDVSVCWKYNRSTGILLGSSARLQSDLIYEAPLFPIPDGDERLSVRYSLLLRQYSLDKAGYEFFELLKKNTESLGSIFDAQPSEIRGNITCVNNPAEVVVGYITARSIQEKRIFISAADVPGWGFSLSCRSTTISADSIKEYFSGGGLSPYDALPGPGGNPSAFLSSSPVCVDCTTRGGSVIKPSYW